MVVVSGVGCQPVPGAGLTSVIGLVKSLDSYSDALEELLYPIKLLPKSVDSRLAERPSSILMGIFVANRMVRFSGADEIFYP